MTIMDIMKILIPCCLGTNYEELIDEHTYATDEKLRTYNDDPSTVDPWIAALKTSKEVLRLIVAAYELNTPALNMHVQEIITSNKPITVQSSYWTKIVLEKLYKAMMELVTKAGELCKKISLVMRKAIDEAEYFAHELAKFQHEYPILAVLIETTALAILIEVSAPFLLEALGFSIEGVVEGGCSTFILSMMLLTGTVQAVSPRDSSPSTLMFRMVPCSQSCRDSLLDTARACMRTEDLERKIDQRHSETELHGIGKNRETIWSFFQTYVHTYKRESVSQSTD